MSRTARRKAPQRPAAPGAALRALAALRLEFGPGLGARKRALLDALEHARLSRAIEVERLHELLCFMRAYPDDRRTLATVERMLEMFARRSDLLRHRAALADMGIAGTTVNYRFFEPTARWLARRWPDKLSVAWAEFEQSDQLEALLPLLAHAAEVPGIDEYAFTTRDWIDRLRGPRETDAAFLIRRMSALRVDGFMRERLYDALDPPIRLAPGADTPSRTAARARGLPVAFQQRPLGRERPDLRAELARPPRAVRGLSVRRAEALIDLTRAAMVTRSRDLDAFSWADPRDARLVDCGDGLQFACLGVIPERRLLFESVYGFLTLKNGVPVGYVLASGLYRSSEVAYNVFETFRGAEAGTIYGRALSMVHHLFGSTSFTIDPYQLGHENDEALDSGAWWFYQKLGYAPHDPGARRLMRRELARMRVRPGHRSTRATLVRLSRANVYFHRGREREDVLGLLPLNAIGLVVSRYLADGWGADRETAATACVDQARRRLGVRAFTGWTVGERLAWKRWAPVLMVIDGLERWTPEQRRGVVEVVRAKGGRRESEFVRRFDAHRRLRGAIARLAHRGALLADAPSR